MKKQKMETRVYQLGVVGDHLQNLSVCPLPKFFL